MNVIVRRLRKPDGVSSEPDVIYLKEASNLITVSHLVPKFSEMLDDLAGPTETLRFRNIQRAIRNGGAITSRLHRSGSTTRKRVVAAMTTRLRVVLRKHREVIASPLLNDDDAVLCSSRD